MGHLCPISIYGSPVTLLKFQMAPKLVLLMSSGSKKKAPRYACLSEAKASPSQRMWAEVSFSAPHLLHSGLSNSPGLSPVKDRNLTLAPRQGPRISSQACLWVSPRSCHHTHCWLTNQQLILLRISCLDSQGRLRSVCVRACFCMPMLTDYEGSVITVLYFIRQ